MCRCHAVLLLFFLFFCLLPYVGICIMYIHPNAPVVPLRRDLLEGVDVGQVEEEEDDKEGVGHGQDDKEGAEGTLAAEVVGPFRTRGT
jgi:hypothetical protein